MSKLLTKSIETKADLKSAIESLQGVLIPGTAKELYASLLSLYSEVRNLHGRSDAAREAAKKAEVVRGKLLIALKNPSQLAPKKSKSKSSNPKKKSYNKKKLEIMNQPAVSGKFLCLCGCGLETNHVELKNGEIRHKLFVQGHDARLKGKIKALAAGKIQKSSLSHYAKEFISRWSVIADEDKEACGIESLDSWETLTESGNPLRSWEEFDEARSDASA